MIHTIPLSIIIVGMNHLIYLQDLFYSIFQEYPPKVNFEVIYVDNCSTDESIKYIEKEFPEVKILKNNKIKGFGENNNYAVSHSQGEYIAIINPDIVLLENSLDFLYEKLIKSPNIGILIPKLLNKDMTLQHSVRRFITLNTLFWRIIAKGNDNSKNTHVQAYVCKDMDYHKEQPIDWGIGAAMMLKRKTFEVLKGFDEDYFLYMEDEDLCLRSWKIGKPVIYYPESRMIHNHLRGSSKIGRKTYLHFKSMFTFFKKHGISVKSLIKKQQ